MRKGLLAALAVAAFILGLEKVGVYEIAPAGNIAFASETQEVSGGLVSVPSSWHSLSKRRHSKV